MIDTNSLLGINPDSSFNVVCLYAGVPSSPLPSPPPPLSSPLLPSPPPLPSPPSPLSSSPPLPSLAQEVEECAALLDKEGVALSPDLGPLRTLPLHAGLGASACQRVYDAEPPARASPGMPGDLGAGGRGGGGRRRGWRRVVLSDAVAEASFSLPGIRYVIDTGLQLKTVRLEVNGAVQKCVCWTLVRGCADAVDKSNSQ